MTNVHQTLFLISFDFNAESQKTFILTDLFRKVLQYFQNILSNQINFLGWNTVCMFTDNEFKILDIHLVKYDLYKFFLVNVELILMSFN